MDIEHLPTSGVYMCARRRKISSRVGGDAVPTYSHRLRAIRRRVVWSIQNRVFVPYMQRSRRFAPARFRSMLPEFGMKTGKACACVVVGLGFLDRTTLRGGPLFEARMMLSREKRDGREFSPFQMVKSSRFDWRQVVRIPMGLV